MKRDEKQNHTDLRWTCSVSEKWIFVAKPLRSGSYFLFSLKWRLEHLWSPIFPLSGTSSLSCSTLPPHSTSLLSVQETGSSFDTQFRCYPLNRILFFFPRHWSLSLLGPPVDATDLELCPWNYATGFPFICILRTTHLKKIICCLEKIQP